jgi:hypothetical protein
MNDIKNIYLAWSASISTMIDAVQSPTLLAVLSAVVLPVLFFTVGKAIDVALQIYLNGRRKDGR